MTKYPRFSSFYLVLFAGLARSVPLDVGYENRSKKLESLAYPSVKTV